MKNFLLIVGMILIVIVLIVSGSNNLKIYNSTQTYNWGMSGGVNAFMSGLVMNGLEVVVLFIGLYLFSRKNKDSRPSELTPVIE
jgi:uncharacterized membrane protein